MDAYDKVNRYVERTGSSKAAAFEKLGVSSSEYYYHKRKREGGIAPVTHEIQSLVPVAVEEGDRGWQLKHGKVILAGSPSDLAAFLSSLVGGGK